MDFSYPFPGIYSSARKRALETCRATSNRPWRDWHILDRHSLYSLKIDHRHRLNKKRRQLIRNAMTDLISRIDHTAASLQELQLIGEREVNEDVEGGDWEQLKSQVQEIEMLLGSALPTPSRSRLKPEISLDTKRCLRFAIVHGSAVEVKVCSTPC